MSENIPSIGEIETIVELYDLDGSPARGRIFWTESSRDDVINHVGRTRPILLRTGHPRRDMQVVVGRELISRSCVVVRSATADDRASISGS